MNFPFSIYRNHEIKFCPDKAVPEHIKNVQVLPPSALYIKNLFTGLGIKVKALTCNDESWIPLYLPDYKRFVAVHIQGDTVLTKIKAKAFVKGYGTPACPLHWIYPSTIYADCKTVLKRITPFS